MTAARDLLAGLDGPEVRVSSRVAGKILGPLRSWIAREQVCDVEVLATLHAMEAACAIYSASEPGSESTSDVGDFPHVGADVVHHAPMTTKAVAELIGCSDRHVRDQAASGALAGRQLASGQWTFDPVDVDRYAAERAAKGA